MKEFLNVALPKGRLGERVYAMSPRQVFPVRSCWTPSGS